MESGPRDGGTDATRYKRAATLLLATPDLAFALLPALDAAAAVLPQAAYRVAESPDDRDFEDVLDAAGVLGYLRATADTLLFLKQTSESVPPRSFRHLLNCTQVAFHAATLRTVLETLIHAAEVGEEPLPALLLDIGSRQWETARLRAQGSALRRRRRSHS
jgi:hypothetical protein